MKTPNISRIARIEIFYHHLHSSVLRRPVSRLFYLGDLDTTRAAAQAVNMMRREAYHEINERQFIFYRRLFILGGAKIVPPFGFL